MFLDRIVATKRTEVEALREGFSLREAELAIAALPACRGFENALAHHPNRSMGLIAEVKKASPSKGLIREDFDPIAIAKAYEEAGADCISVLTDREYFQGDAKYLREVRANVRLPLLRKDFIIDFRQIYEARLMGADAVLLIAAILTSGQLQEYLTISRALGMDALVEVHDLDELERVLELEAMPKLIGVNNRNLRSFVTDLATTEELSSRMPADRIMVSESGIAEPGDIRRLQSAGARAVLVGEQFMRRQDISKAVEDLMGPLSVRTER